MWIEVIEPSSLSPQLSFRREINSWTMSLKNVININRLNVNTNAIYCPDCGKYH